MLFLSTFHNRIDKKNRVSVPATYRAVLSAQDYSGIIVYSSIMHRCIEACGMNRINKMNERIDALDPYSAERDAFSASVFGDSVQLPFDGEGRVVLPESLIKDIGLSDMATFVGKGEIFEIWEPKAFEAYMQQARELARAKRNHLFSKPEGKA
jgi:MraZ protein